jgi:hypothetical protein
MEASPKVEQPFALVPVELKERKQWVLWKLESRSGKQTKVPYQCSGSLASAINQNHWASFEEVTTTLSSNREFSGIGFVFNGSGIVGIDFDKCVEDGEVDPNVLEAIEALDSYTEISPSGKGFHTFILGSLPNGSGNRRGQFEVYETGRFFTVTGEHYGATPQTIEERQEQLEDFLETYINRKVVPLNGDALLSSETTEAEVQFVIDRAEGAKNGDKFLRLFRDADTSDYDGDVSRAVAGLVWIIAFYTKKPAVIDAVFRRSALHSKHWSEKWKRLGSKEINKALSEQVAADTSTESDNKKQKASFEDVCNLIRQTFPEKPPRRDLLSEELHVWHNGRWQKALSKEPQAILESTMRHSGGFYSAASLPADVIKYSSTLEPLLLLDLPDWDGRDRVRELAFICNITNISKEHLAEFLKDWGAKMFLRASDNRKYQNRCIIVKGEQGIGKDHWINAITGGLGELASEITFDNYDERKTQMTMAEGLVMKISEFERANKTAPAVLKNYITMSSASFVPPYGRTRQTFEIRCSWIASANTFDFFRDHTGNRRFLVFVLDGVPKEAITWNYPDSEADKLQVLAQFRRLAEEGFKASDEAERKMSAYTKSMTPSDPAEQVVFDFDMLVAQKIRINGGAAKVDYKDWRGVWIVSNQELDSWNIYKSLKEIHGMPARIIQNHLTAQGRGYRGRVSRGYVVVDRSAAVDDVTLVTDPEGEVSLEVSPLSF